ncbi:MAG: PIN domain-containing protein [Solirubrobacteraceae bacterium]
MALICDTGPLYAAMDRADTDHEACKQLLSDASERLLVPAPVVVELEWLASSRLGLQPFSSFLADVEADDVTIVDLIRADYVRVRELLTRYADLKLGFVDAAVVAIVERLNERKLATLDHRHFTTVRPKHTDAIELLPH